MQHCNSQQVTPDETVYYPQKQNNRTIQWNARPNKMPFLLYL